MAVAPTWVARADLDDAALRSLDAPSGEFLRTMTYFDTPSGTLARAGLAAWVTQESGEVALAPIPIGEVGPLRARLSAPGGPAPAQAIAALARSDAGLELDDVAETMTVRVRGTTWAGVTVERLAIVHNDARLTTVAVEGPAPDGFAEALSAAGAAPAKRTTYEELRRAAGRPPIRYGPGKPTFDGTVPLAVVARRVCSGLLATIVAHVPGTRLGYDHEQLHKMRVATRRLRTALRVFRGAYPKEERRAVGQELRWLGRVLGAVRDLDVYLLTDWTTLSDQVQWEPLLSALRARHARARTAMLEALSSDRYVALMRDAGALFASEPIDPGPRIDAAAKTLIDDAGARLTEAIAKLHLSGTAADAHRVRIVGKRVRYTCEFLRPVLAKASENGLARLSAFQDKLGDLQDAVSRGDLARELARQAGAGAAPAFAHACGVLEGIGIASGQAAPAVVENALAGLQLRDLLESV